MPSAAVLEHGSAVFTRCDAVCVTSNTAAHLCWAAICADLETLLTWSADFEKVCTYLAIHLDLFHANEDLQQCCDTAEVKVSTYWRLDQAEPEKQGRFYSLALAKESRQSEVMINIPPRLKWTGRGYAWPRTWPWDSLFSITPSQSMAQGAPKWPEQCAYYFKPGNNSRVQSIEPSGNWADNLLLIQHSTQVLRQCKWKWLCGYSFNIGSKLYIISLNLLYISIFINQKEVVWIYCNIL